MILQNILPEKLIPKIVHQRRLKNTQTRKNIHAACVLLKAAANMRQAEKIYGDFKKIRICTGLPGSSNTPYREIILPRVHKPRFCGRIVFERIVKVLFWVKSGFCGF